MLYVNNGQISLGKTSFSISSSEITAAQSLVKTYGEILNNRTTLQRVIDKTKIPYTYKELSHMVASAPANDTEIIRVTVTSSNPYEASDIANCIAEVLPDRIAEIIDGASMEVVDAAVPAIDKVSPSNTRNTALGMFVGVLLSIAVLVFFIIRDDTIHSEEYITQTYNYPILARIPDLAHPGAKNRSYYSQKTDR
jgi:capsular polysaccharide biosynthesis protein